MQWPIFFTKNHIRSHWLGGYTQVIGLGIVQTKHQVWP
jgi:ribosome modulation factor